ncbi:DUF317 domain-containing protein [Geitlerinema sp. PCC 7407]|uniref:DUF317 domain-containing protein n=1 Tax=Geitlerinema sp. PCC 7407 TaxID=1173025 RepID=UPI0037C03BA7
MVWSRAVGCSVSRAPYSALAAARLPAWWRAIARSRARDGLAWAASAARAVPTSVITGSHTSVCPWRNSRAVGYQGQSERSKSQRQSGA